MIVGTVGKFLTKIRHLILWFFLMVLISQVAFGMGINKPDGEFNDFLSF